MADEALLRLLQQRNKAGDLDAIPVPQEDNRPFLKRLGDMLSSGGWQDPQPGQRGTFVPGQVGQDGKVSPAVPGIIQQPAESLQALMTAPLGDIVRSGDRDAIRAASEASFDVSSMLPAAGVAAGRTMSAATEGAAPLRTYHGRRDPNPDFDVMRNSKEVWSSTNPAVAGDYASKYGKVQGAVVPMDTTLANPMRVQPPRGTQYDAIPFDGGTYDIRQLAKMARERGHDGMIVQGVMDSPELPAPPGRVGDTVVSFQHGSVKSPFTGETLFSNADDPNTAAILLATMTGQGEKKGITAYHGSPHDFDRFDTSKIGTGEGAQAYGHGLYFAENEGVARSYRDALGNYDDAVKWKGEQPPTPVQQKVLDKLKGYDVARDEAASLDSVERELARGIVRERLNEGSIGYDPQRSARRIADLTEQLTALRAMKDQVEVTPPGRMYEVRINADPADFLDWDKPIQGQPAKARSVLESFDPAVEHYNTPDQPIGNWRQSMSSRDATLEKALREAGIPGIRYLDQGSRTAGEGSRNYVVFDDALVEIMRKYANAADPTTAAILALLTAQQGGQPQQ